MLTHWGPDFSLLCWVCLIWKGKGVFKMIIGSLKLSFPEYGIWRRMCGIYCLFAADGGTSLLGCPVLNMGQGSLTHWSLCEHGIAATLAPNMPRHELFLHSCAEILRLLKNIGLYRKALWRILWHWIVSICFLANVTRQKKRELP